MRELIYGNGHETYAVRYCMTTTEIEECDVDVFKAALDCIDLCIPVSKYRHWTAQCLLSCFELHIKKNWGVICSWNRWASTSTQMFLTASLSLHRCEPNILTLTWYIDFQIIYFQNQFPRFKIKHMARMRAQLQGDFTAFITPPVDISLLLFYDSLGMY